MKIAFLVGSFLKTYAGGSPSAYTLKERVDQTRETLRSIREKCPEATIYLVEGSEANPVDYELDYDHLVLPGSDETARQLIFSNEKSIGECTMMIYTGMSCALADYDLVFKISGRYRLTEDFSLDNFSKDKFTFYDHVQWGYETTLYAFPGKLKDVWIENLQKSITFMRHNSLDSIERSLRMLMNVKYVQGAEKLGIEGYNAPMKRFIKY